ncbi:MAG: hypothetical protein JST66_16805 [Bacteroidetes bacterium]|nr:hypothetical protein [Bacteroidota bacterium]
MAHTKERRVHITDLHSDHRIWLNALTFYKEEIGILEHRLQEIAERNTGTDVRAELEQFQNRFIRQREVIDELRHDLTVHEDALMREAREHPIAIDHHLFQDHVAQREAMDRFEELYRQLKAELMRWLMERM